MLKIGIVGLPNVGKSTLFKALTKKPVEIANYPFCTIKPNFGVVEVSDLRLDKISEIFPEKKKIPPIVEFVDIAGLVRGASKGEGLGNQFLTHIREVDAILEVVRFFENKDVAHSEGEIDPERDIEIINTELCLADLETVKKRIQKVEKIVKSQDKGAIKELEVLRRVENLLSQGKRLVRADLEKEEKEILKPLNLLTLKPTLYVYNYAGREPKISENLRKKNYVFLDTKTEDELLSLSEEEISDLGIPPQIDQAIKKSYSLLDLITFYTIGESEVKAWEVKKGTKAPQAGGVIHSDFENKFVKAEVINWQKFLEVKSWQKAREGGLLKIVGKDYQIEDGDVVYFLIRQ